MRRDAGEARAAIERRLCDERSWWSDMVRRYAATCGILWCIASASAADGMYAEQVRSFSNFSGSAGVEFFMAQDVAPAPGLTLSAVEFGLSLTISGGGLMIDNDGPQSGVVNVFFQASLLLVSEDVAIPTTQTSIVNVGQLGVGADDEHMGGAPVFDFDGGPDVNMLPPLESANAESLLMLNPVFIDQFRGSGTFDASAELVTRFNITGLPTVAGSFTGLNVEDASVRLRYTYVPAAPTSALLAAGLLGWRRRRRA